MTADNNHDSAPVQDENHSGMPLPSTETVDQDEVDVASQDESSASSDGSLYLESTNIRVSASGTPLRNTPVGSKSMSSESVKILESNAHEPYTCILTRATDDSGFDIDRTHIIPRSTKGQELRAYEWMLGYDASTFNLDSHYNVTFLKEDLHSAFDRGNWALVPVESERKRIIDRLQSYRFKKDPTSRTSPWPIFKKACLVTLPIYADFTFTQVYRRRKGVYPYAFVNIRMRVDIPIYTSDGTRVINPNNDDALLQSIESHIHPFHVIINAHQKFELWVPKPKDGPTLEIINDIRNIWDLLNTPLPLDGFLNYGRKDNTRSNPSDTQSHQSRSSLGKRSSCDNDTHEASTSSRRLRRRSDREPADGVPSLMDGHSSRASSPEPFDSEFENEVRSWQASLREFSTLSPPHHVSIDNMEQALSELVAVSDIAHWEPDWDTRHYDTKKFSSNDWALLRSKCYLTNHQ